MGVSLAEALRQDDLETGEVYQCEVKGRWVELRVLESVEAGPSRSTRRTFDLEGV